MKCPYCQSYSTKSDWSGSIWTNCDCPHEPRIVEWLDDFADSVFLDIGVYLRVQYIVYHKGKPQMVFFYPNRQLMWIPTIKSKALPTHVFVIPTNVQQVFDKIMNLAAFL